MYVFEILSECHLTLEQLNADKGNFYSIFEKALSDTDTKVNVAALKATSSFLTSIEDEATLQVFQPLMQLILNTMVEALKTEEEQGKLALESIVELTKIHPQCWKGADGALTT